MRLGSRRGLAVLVAAAVCAGAAFAGSADAANARAQKLGDRIVSAHLGKAAVRPAKDRLLVRSARYIGVTPKALRAELKAGKSLAQVAAAHGKTAAGLKNDLLKPFQQRLAKAQAADRINAPDAQARLARISARLDKIINRTR